MQVDVVSGKNAKAEDLVGKDFVLFRHQTKAVSYFLHQLNLLHSEGH